MYEVIYRSSGITTDSVLIDADTAEVANGMVTFFKKVKHTAEATSSRSPAGPFMYVNPRAVYMVNYQVFVSAREVLTN